MKKIMFFVIAVIFIAVNTSKAQTQKCDDCLGTVKVDNRKEVISDPRSFVSSTNLKDKLTCTVEKWASELHKLVNRYGSTPKGSDLDILDTLYRPKDASKIKTGPFSNSWFSPHRYRISYTKGGNFFYSKNQGKDEYWLEESPDYLTSNYRWYYSTKKGKWLLYAKEGCENIIIDTWEIGGEGNVPTPTPAPAPEMLSITLINYNDNYNPVSVSNENNPDNSNTNSTSTGGNEVTILDASESEPFGMYEQAPSRPIRINWGVGASRFDYDYGFDYNQPHYRQNNYNYGAPPIYQNQNPYYASQTQTAPPRTYQNYFNFAKPTGPGTDPNPGVPGHHGTFGPDPDPGHSGQDPHP